MMNIRDKNIKAPCWYCRAIEERDNTDACLECEYTESMDVLKKLLHQDYGCACCDWFRGMDADGKFQCRRNNTPEGLSCPDFKVDWVKTEKTIG